MKILSTSKEWPEIAVYDIETTEWINVYLVCHIDELGNRVSFSGISDYVTWLFSDFSGCHVWAHAGGRFDHRFIIPEIKSRGWGLKICMSGGTIVLMIADNGKKKIFFADSYRLMPNALKSIGKTVGLEKLDVNRSKMETLTHEQSLEYCFRDCEITLKGLQLMKKALTTVNADFAFTLASVASRWVRRSDSIDWNQIYADQTRDPNHTVDTFCEPAYFGGRTEMFRQGMFDGPIYYYDVVSSYPASMGLELPLYFKEFIPAPRNKGESVLREYLSYTGITEAYVDIPLAIAEPLCVRYDGRLVFPYGKNIGRYSGKERKMIPGRWTNIELLAALDRGARIRPIVQARFEGAPFLSKFVSTFYGLRKQAKAEKDAFRTYAYKILLNSLYGKLTETSDRTSYVTSFPDIPPKDSRIDETSVRGVYCLSSKEEGPFRHIAAGAYVTAYSRLKLLEGIEEAIKLGGQIYYCDTDSIMTNVRLDHLQGSELGQWQLEHTFDRIELVLPKVYKAEIKGQPTIYRCKGMPMTRENDPPNMAEMRWEAFKQYSLTKDPDMSALLSRSGLTGFVADINAGSLYPRTTDLVRCLQGKDRKRDWQGPNSRPIRIEGDK